ncbi:peptide chain release factor N(5)-glutamine methyltransferase [Candidatus Endowatersipora endosymbiont of Watersipora subatra]|uniref:peptide chain release factor N(5)-glutamine methyltransferase n=1 Tax=Candidatus Endowatersipora endosymbiont of Watersipora subatra TaxID=3077946 RepID=UPI00312CB04B
MKITYEGMLISSTAKLAASGSLTPALDARLLLQHELKCEHADIVKSYHEELKSSNIDHFQSLIKMRISGVPVHRIIGQRDFYGLELIISPETLEPRPETERLIDLVLHYLYVQKIECNQLRFADLGTGTGAIGLAILSQLPNSTCLATDILKGTLNIAKKNAEILGFSNRLSVSLGSWYDAVDGKFDFLVSNPPYISGGEFRDLSKEVLEHDPFIALYGGKDGLTAYRRILKNAFRFLKPKGFVALEIGHRQRKSVIEIANKFSLLLADSFKDLERKDRCLLFTLKE